MPEIDKFLPLIGGAVSAGSGIIGSYMSQRYHQKMYERQLSDSLKYSDPSFIMGRYKAAGLNPHLIYGNSSNSHVQVPNYSAPNFEGVSNAGGNFFNSMVNIKTQNAQLEAIKADIAVKNEQARNIAADTDSKIYNTRYQAPANVMLTYSQENKNRREIQSITDNFLLANRRYMLDESNSLFDKALRYKDFLLKEKDTNSRIKVNNSQIRHFSAMIDNLNKDGILKETEINLRKFNVSWNDSLMARIFALGVSDPTKFRDAIKGFNNIFREMKGVYSDAVKERRMSINNPIGRMLFDVIFPN